MSDKPAPPTYNGIFLVPIGNRQEYLVQWNDVPHAYYDTVGKKLVSLGWGSEAPNTISQEMMKKAVVINRSSFRREEDDLHDTMQDASYRSQ